MLELKIFSSNSVDPFYNLAVENQLLMQIKPHEKYLFLYQNAPSIIMGRFQNPWVECDLAAIKQDGIHLVRRQSGGGTVYHDLGNLNFCFIHGHRDHHKDQNNQIVLDALSELDICAHTSGRSDLIIDHQGIKKFSGAAFKQKKDSSFHHGTLLINSDLDKLNNYLKSSKRDIESKAIKSNPATVINLSLLNGIADIASYRKAISKSFLNFYSDKYSDSTDIAIEVMDQTYMNSLMHANWIYGETPEFKFSVANTDLDMQIKVKKGTIIELSLVSESIDIQLLNLIATALQGKYLYGENLDLFFQEFCQQYGESVGDIRKVQSFFQEHFSY